MLRITVLKIWCLNAATVTALLPTASVFGTQLDRVQRRRSLFVQAGWMPCVDGASGETYYYHEQTGASQWHSPLAGPAEFLWRLVPVAGAYSPGGGVGLHNDEEQIIGRFDMFEQDIYVSRAQCRVQVAADGTATLTSLGKPPTLVLASNGGPWYGLQKDEIHVLADGTEICLTGKATSVLASQAVKQGHQ